MQNSTYLCPKDRKVMKGHSICPTCGLSAVGMGRSWRAPKLTNEAAWRRVQSGDYLWERPVRLDPRRLLGRERAQKKKSSGVPKWFPRFYSVPASNWNEEIRQAILLRME
jgi:hypothetical protein